MENSAKPPLLQFVMCRRSVTRWELERLFPTATAFEIRDFGRGFSVAGHGIEPTTISRAMAELQPWKVLGHEWTVTATGGQPAKDGGDDSKWVADERGGFAPF